MTIWPSLTDFSSKSNFTNFWICNFSKLVLILVIQLSLLDLWWHPGLSLGDLPKTCKLVLVIYLLTPNSSNTDNTDISLPVSDLWWHSSLSLGDLPKTCKIVLVIYSLTPNSGNTDNTDIKSSSIRPLVTLRPLLGRPLPKLAEAASSDSSHWLLQIQAMTLSLFDNFYINFKMI